MNSGINLLAEKKKTNAPLLRRINIMRWIAMSLLFVVAVSSMILFFLIALSPLPELQEQESQRENTFATFRTPMSKLIILHERMDSVSTLLAQRNNVDQTFESVITKLPKDVVISSFSLKENNLVVTVSSSSLASIDLFLNTILTAAEENNEFSQVILKDVSRDDEAQKFFSTISMTVL